MAISFNFKLCLTYYVCIFSRIYLWASARENSVENFEGDKKYFHLWSTNLDGPHFRVVNSSTQNIPGAPVVDATQGNGEGKFCIAEFQSPSNISWLFSPCFQPSNPKCTLKFSGFLNIGAGEEFHVCAMKQCEMCQPTRYDKCFYKKVFTHTDNWTVFDIPIGYSPIPFDIQFAASFLHPGSFVALDDIEIIDCDAEEVEEELCGYGHVFQCNYTNACIARDQLCDLIPDCDCGDDEIGVCSDFPPEGRVTLEGCNLDDGSCLWYNALEEIADENGGRRSRRSPEQPQHYRWEIQKSDKKNYTEGNDVMGYFEGPYMSVDIPPYPQSAILRSVSLKPRYAGGGQEICQIRFHYLVRSRSARLQLVLVEVGRGMEKKGAAKRRTLWEDSVTETGDGQDDVSTVGTKPSLSQWKRVVVDLNAIPINVSYVLQFSVTALTPESSGQVRIHSLTLGWECFSPDMSLTTCGNLGAKGPDQALCDDYHSTTMMTNVIDSGWEEGVQTWTVPDTQDYGIHAYGARGGWGLRVKHFLRNSRGAKVTATFHLKAGEQLRFLVGQTGSEACPEDLWNLLPAFCLKNASHDGGGGGGGGGATIVYKKGSNNENIVLLVAGGGGGLPFDIFDHMGTDLFASDVDERRRRSSTVDTPVSENTDKTHALMMDMSEAEKLLRGSLWGTAGCTSSTSPPKYWGGSGGFGAGGGACSSGGHGGGIIVSGSKYEPIRPAVGLPGLSFVHPDALSHTVDIDFHEFDGIAEVESLWYCPCAYRCMWKGPGFDSPVCLCPKGEFLQEDGSSCEDFKKTDNTSGGKYHITIIVLVTLVVVVVGFCIFCVCVYVRRPSIANGLPIRLKKTIQILCPCFNLTGRPLTFNSHVLPQITNPPAVMQENSIYNRVATKGSEQSLNEIPRKHLKLIGELGQGAFGEVFYGLLSHMPMVEGDLPVAVKTLPAVCTEQTEMDFLLEALIVSKFNHPNIVKFIGTCFDQHPHYLILELLEGGDLKSFLYQARPKRGGDYKDVPSTITMIDLLRLSLDISRGCQHLEEKHFIHRDIAARNCLLTTKGPNRIAKIADFGMARDIYRSDYYRKAGRAMLPVKWMPPEAFLDGVFTSKTDVWSYGILLWEVFSLGHMPYPGCSNEEVMNLVTRGGRLEPPVGCPSSVCDVMTSCWAGIAEARPNFTLIIAILERTIQDDETSSRGLPVYYTAPIIHSRRTFTKDSCVYPLSASKGGACSQVSDQSTNSRQSKLQVNYEKEQSYLEPLISRHTGCSTSKHIFFPT